MIIKIEKILEDKNVLFSSEFGKCIGIWCEDIVLLKKYSVEIDIISKISLDNLKESKIEEYKLYFESNDKIVIIGLLESYEDDGFATLRIKNDIICFTTDYNNEILELLNKFIKIEVTGIKLFNQKII